MTFCVATLSSKHGFETKSPEEALSLHFMYWFTSRRSQGKVKDAVPSFYYLVGQHGTNPERLQEAARTELLAYMKELFPQVEVFVNRKELPGSNSQYHLIIGATISHEDKKYNLAQTIIITGEEFRILDKARLG